jgi:molybdopterin-guanine dinucleotide biosynthesis protein A
MASASPASRLGVVLTGGASRRMGSPKELLDAGGQPLLSRVLAAVGPACPLWLVVARPGQPLPALPPGVRRVEDPPGLEGEGPLVGLLAALRAAPPSAQLAFVCAVDAPLVDAAHVEQVLSTLAASPSHEAVAPVTHEDALPRLHPLSSALRVAPARRAAEELVKGGERRLKALFAALRTLELPVEQLARPEALASCNTPEEWAALELRAGWRRGQP